MAGVTEASTAAVDDDLDDWFRTVKNDFLSEPSPEKSEAAYSPRESILPKEESIQNELSDNLNEDKVNEIQKAAPIMIDDCGKDIESITDNWKLDTFDFPDKLCREIQSAVDAAADRLAGETPPAPPSETILPPPGPSSNLVLIMEVVIGDGRTETIQIYQGDDAAGLAAVFAKKHGLEVEVIPTLIEHIQEQLNGITTESKTEEDRRPSEKEQHYNFLLDKFGKVRGSKSFDHVKPQAKVKSPSRGNSTAACERLYALAQVQREWRQRAQKKKNEEITKEIQEKKLQLAEKTKQIVASRTNGQYRTIGERLYGEAMSEAARKKKIAESRAALSKEEDLTKDWICPKCTHVNRFHDTKCQNSIVKKGLVTVPAATSSSNRVTKGTKPSKQTITIGAPSPHQICGQQKPTLFQPTLVSKENKKPVPDEVLVLRRQKHQEVARAEYDQRHPFTPQVNPNSIELVKEKRPKNPHAALYNDANSRRERLKEKEEEYHKQFPYRPNIGINSFVATSTPDALYHRLAIEDREKMNQTRAKLFEKYGAAKDPDTGRSYFKPETGRGPQFPRNETNLPIGQFLYESRREFDEIHRQLHQAHINKLRDHRSQSFMSKTSRQHLKQRKAKSYERIFSLLQAACVSSKTIEVDPEVLNPALLQMESLSHELGHVALSLFETCGWVPIPKSNFHACMELTVASCEHLTHTQVLFFEDKPPKKILTTQEKQAAADDSELTLHPQINERSSRMATQHRASVQVYDAMYKYHETYMTKRKKLQAQLEAEASKVYTFHPTFIASKSSHRDLYATIPDDDELDHENAITLTTANPCARPYVRPLNQDPLTT